MEPELSENFMPTPAANTLLLCYCTFKNYIIINIVYKNMYCIQMRSVVKNVVIVANELNGPSSFLLLSFMLTIGR